MTQHQAEQSSANGNNGASSAPKGNQKQQTLADMISSFQLNIPAIPTLPSHYSASSSPAVDLQESVRKNTAFTVHTQTATHLKDTGSGSSTKFMGAGAGAKKQPLHKRHFSHDDSVLMGCGGSPLMGNADDLFATLDDDELIGDDDDDDDQRLNIKEALEGMDDKTLNGLVQAIDCSVARSPPLDPTEASYAPPPFIPSMSTMRGMQDGSSKSFWTPVQKLHQINEYWASAATPPQITASLVAGTGVANAPAVPVSPSTDSYGSMLYWQKFVEEFFDADAFGGLSSAPSSSSLLLGSGGGSSSSDIGLIVWVQETAIRMHERNVGVPVPKKPYFIPRSLIPRFFWTMAGGVESEKMSEPPMTRCHLAVDRIRESFVTVQRRGQTSTLLLLETATATLQIRRSNGLLTEQCGSLRLWFTMQSRIVRWEWNVESAYEWRLVATSVYSGYHGKTLKLIAGFTPRTWGVLELAHLTKTYASIVPFIASPNDEEVMVEVTKRPIPRVNRTRPILSAKSDSGDKKEAVLAAPHPQQPAGQAGISNASLLSPPLSSKGVQMLPASGVQSAMSHQQPQTCVPAQQAAPPPYNPMLQLHPNVASHLMMSFHHQQQMINHLQRQMSAIMGASSPASNASAMYQHHPSAITGSSMSIPQHSMIPPQHPQQLPAQAIKPLMPHRRLTNPELYPHPAAMLGPPPQPYSGQGFGGKTGFVPPEKRREAEPQAKRAKSSITKAASPPIAPDLTPRFEEDPLHQFIVDEYIISSMHSTAPGASGSSSATTGAFNPGSVSSASVLSTRQSGLNETEELERLLLGGGAGTYHC